MKIAPVSADLLIKLALVAAAAGAVYFVYKKISAPVANILDGLGDVADSTIAAINPASPDNLINRGVTAIGGALVAPDGEGRNADGSWTLGGWLFDKTNSTSWAATTAPALQAAHPNPTYDPTPGIY